MVPPAINAPSSTDYLEERHNYLGPACSPQLIGVTATSNPRSFNCSTRFSTNRESGARPRLSGRYQHCWRLLQRKPTDFTTAWCGRESPKSRRPVSGA